MPLMAGCNRCVSMATTFAVYNGQDEVAVRFVMQPNPGASQRGQWRVVCDRINKRGEHSQLWSEWSWASEGDAAGWAGLLNQQNKDARFRFYQRAWHWG